MSIQVVCTNPQCLHPLSFPESLGGKDGQCPKCGKVFQIPPAKEEQPAPTNRQLGQYTLVRKLGEGGMGAVYEAVQSKLDRHVALKVLSRGHTQDGEFVQRFEREAKAAAALNHAHIVQVYDFGEDQGHYYFAMEYVDGKSLQAWLDRKGKIPLKEALEIALSVAKALLYAHARSIIHRDIKPDNIMLTRDGQVKLADLGLAKSLKEEVGVTQTGVALGTPYYMAPEQAQDARRADHRADIYSLGITLLHLLTGRRPFEGKNTVEIIFAHMEKPLPSCKELGTEIHPEAEALIRKMCAKEPAERFQDYASLIAKIERLRASLVLGSAPPPRSEKKISRPAPAASPMAPAPAAPSLQPTGQASATPSAGSRGQQNMEGSGAPAAQAVSPPVPFLSKSQKFFLAGAGVAVAAILLLAILFSLTRHGKRPTSGPGDAVKPPENKVVDATSNTASETIQDAPAFTTPSAMEDTAPSITPEAERGKPVKRLPAGLRAAFELPTEDQDQYGNPVRKGFDEETGMPLEIRHKASGMHLVFIPKGEFMMGSSEEEEGHESDESPFHNVQISMPFYMGKYEVTQEEWGKVMENNPSRFQGTRLPVEQVTRFHCHRYIELLNRQIGAKRLVQFALPTEAQWEYACRAGSGSPFFFHDLPNGDELDNYAWFTNNSNGMTHPVGKKQPNPWGLYDIHGNVGEICDWVGEYQAEMVTDPACVLNGAGRIHRGGSWGSTPELCRAGERWVVAPLFSWTYSGMRLCLHLHGKVLSDTAPLPDAPE